MRKLIKGIRLTGIILGFPIRLAIVIFFGIIWTLTVSSTAGDQGYDWDEIKAFILKGKLP